MRKAAFLTILALVVLLVVGTLLLQSMIVLQRVAAVRYVEGEVVLQARGAEQLETMAGRDRI